MMKFSVLFLLISMASCNTGSSLSHTYIHDQAYVNMFLDITLANKIHSKTHHTNRDNVMDTIFIQLEKIHGKSMEEFDTYLRQVSDIPVVYEEFLDSVNVARKRLEHLIQLDSISK